MQAFFGGLETLVGEPGSNRMTAMLSEHCEMKDSLERCQTATCHTATCHTAAFHTAALATCFPRTPSCTPVLSQELAHHVEPLHDPPTGPTAI